MEAKEGLFDISMDGNIELTMQGKGVDAAKIGRTFPAGREVTVRIGDDSEVVQVMIVDSIHIESDPNAEGDYENVHATITLKNKKRETPRRSLKKRKSARKRECANCLDYAEEGSDYCSDCEPEDDDE